MKRKRLEYVCVGEEFELKLWRRKWKYGNPHPKQQESPPEPTNTKEDIRLEQIKKVNRSALQWDDFVLQEQLKSIMYVERLPCEDLKKDKFIGELNFKNYVHLKIKTTRKFFVGITHTRRKLIIHPEYFFANNIFSHLFIQNPKHKPNMVQDLSRQTKIAFKKIDRRTVSNIKYTKYYTSLARIVK